MNHLLQYERLRGTNFELVVFKWICSLRFEIMKNLILTLFMLLSINTLVLAYVGENPVNVPGLTYLIAKQSAEQKQMKYVLYFKADWCSPCKWMEESTFKDETIIAAMGNTFLLVPLDIDEFEGYALKEYFQVHTLPTFLVFDASHQITNRSEGSLSPSRLLELISTNKQAQPVSADANEVVNTAPEINMTKPSVTSEAPAETLPQKIAESVTRYCVQLGVFSSYANAERIVTKAQKYTTQTIEIVTVPKGNSFIYKVFAGKLTSEEQAMQLKKTLNNYGIDGFVKAEIIGSKS